MDADLFTQTPAAAAGDLNRVTEQIKPTARSAAHDVPGAPVPTVGQGQALLATWRQLIDDGALLVDEPHLAGTARRVVARVSKATAAALGEPHSVTVSTDRGSVTLPVAIADLPDDVVWLPGHTPGSTLRTTLGVGHGAVVSIAAGGER
jgi:NADH-quinone oxidoreductase subunit G